MLRLGFVSLGLVVVALSQSQASSRPLAGQARVTQTVRVTAYLPTGSVMYDGEYPFEGAAACSWDFPEGTKILFTQDGREVECLDRGPLGSGFPESWIDIFCDCSLGTANWLMDTHYADQHAEIEIMRWGYGD